jgi:hypothetical protein
VKHARYYWLLLAESHLTRQLFKEYGAADRGAVASGGIAEAVAERSIQSQEGTEGCLKRPDGKAVVSSCGTRVGPDGTVSRVLGPAKESNYALESPRGYIVLGCWELKRKFRG